MHDDRFDLLTRALGTRDSRRDLSLRLLGVPIFGGLMARLGSAPEAAATRDVHRNALRGRHKSRKKRPKRKQPRPTPPCPACLARDAAGQCVVDPSQNRTPCAGTAGATSVCCNGVCCPGCCDAAGTCGACRVFVTADPPFKGNLGGLIGADATCLARAQAEGLPGALIPGNYKAWLSDSTQSPSTRFRCTQTACSIQGYRLVNGTDVVADNWADLTVCAGTCLDHAIDRTETNGALTVPAAAWTHTNTDGTAGGIGNVHCQNWGSNDNSLQGDFGSAPFTDDTWTRVGMSSCDTSLRLYCFQQS